MAVDFRVTEHRHRPGVKIVSAHVKEVQTDEEFAGRVIEDDGSATWPPIPSVYISFEPSPYEIRGNKIVKLSTH